MSAPPRTAGPTVTPTRQSTHSRTALAILASLDGQKAPPGEAAIAGALAAVALALLDVADAIREAK